MFENLLLESPDPNNPVNRFDFVFLYSDCVMQTKTSSLAELIVAQHEKHEDIKHIKNNSKKGKN